MGPSSATTSSSHGHHFVITNPFSHTEEVDEEEYERARRATSTPNPPATPASPGFFTHFLPRHAYFHVKVVVHQISNIPLVSGEYAAQWRFKGVHSLPSAKAGNNSGLLSSIVKNKHKGSAKGKERDYEHDAQTLEHDDFTDDSGSLNSSEHHHSTDWAKGTSIQTASSSSSSSSNSPSTPQPSTTTSASSWMPTGAIGPPPNTQARGQTPFLKLRDHNVKWEHTLSTIIRMDIDRDPASNMLLSTPLKLTILQRDSTFKPDKTGAHGVITKQLGNVVLDLAQYALKGDVTRQYLLRDSKTNATLKVSILTFPF
jgi:hypothetical protein